MRYRLVSVPAVLGIVCGLAVARGVGIVCGGSAPKPLPPLSQVEEVTLRHFALLLDYRPGDVIAQSEVEPLFAQLRLHGWTVMDGKAILQQVPADSDFVIRELHSPRGREFMHRISGYPNAYDRLDRLSRLPRGRQTVRDLIRTKGGHEMIEYMTTAPGGTGLGKMLSKAPKGADFNKPTGRIYTVEMLLNRMKESYRAAEKAAGREKAVP